MGFGMNLHEVLRAGRSGFLYTACGIAFALTVGLFLGRLLQVNKTSSLLISAGTAICGGSAIAAVAPIIQADAEETAISLGTIFILNSIALLIFPLLGWALHLTQEQFGLWSALAIHDTSSVVGATARYGPAALVVGTTVKLTRALWIVPVALGVALVKHSKTKIQWPWFILLFCLAAVVNTYVPALTAFSQTLNMLGTIRPDGNFISDRDRNIPRNAQASGRSAFVTGSDPLVSSGNYFAVVDLAWNYFDVGGKLILY